MDTFGPDENNGLLKASAEKIQPNPYSPVKPGVVYNTMIIPLLNYKVAGAIWYQGEGNTDAPGTYDSLLITMIAAWRKAWNSELPFYYVQIAPYTYGTKDIGALLREAQTKALRFPHTGMIVSNDLVNDTTNVHPKNKHDIGYRLADWALAENYNQRGIIYKSPKYKNMIIDKNKVVISFEDPAGLMSHDQTVHSIFIAGNDKIFYPADAKLAHDQLIVWSNKVKLPVAVRYAFSNAGIGNLQNAAGLPVCPFRTDNW